MSERIRLNSGMFGSLFQIVQLSKSFTNEAGKATNQKQGCATQQLH